MSQAARRLRQARASMHLAVDIVAGLLEEGGGITEELSRQVDASRDLFDLRIAEAMKALYLGENSELYHYFTPLEKVNGSTEAADIKDK